MSLLPPSDTDGDRNIQCLSLVSPFDVALLSVLTESEMEKMQWKILLNTIIVTMSSVFLFVCFFVKAVDNKLGFPRDSRFKNFICHMLLLNPQ